MSTIVMDTTEKKKVVGIYVAHEDDAILALAGMILHYIAMGYEVYIVVVTDCRNSHKIVLNIETNPTVWQVRDTRAAEMIKAMAVLGVHSGNIHFLNWEDGQGNVWGKDKLALKQLLQITRARKPDIVFFHHVDAHIDHRAVNKLVMKMLGKLRKQPEAHEFFIWTEELAQASHNHSLKDIPKVPDDAIKIFLTAEEIDLKRRSLFEMASQVRRVQPYPGWQIQKHPILEQSFIKHFLRGEETFVKCKP